jgi:hypothetical protein
VAQRTMVIVTDDIDGTEGAETVTFGLNGTQFEIDLAQKNADKLRKALAPYIDAGHKVGGSRPSSGSRRAASTVVQPDPKVVRAWALESGLDVSTRGRIPASVVEQYNAAR